MRSKRTKLFRILGAAACVAVAALGSLGVRASSPHGAGGAAAPVAGPSPTCAIADLAGVTLTVADARELRALLKPPPSEEQACRLAVDAALAHLELRGHLAGAPTKARLEAYRELMNEVRKSQPRPLEAAEASLALMDALRVQHGLSVGPCYPAPARHPKQ